MLILNTENPAEYLARAEMHEQLALATDDIPARKMHLAMAAAYRRKATEVAAAQMVSPRASGPILKFSVATR